MSDDSEKPEKHWEAQKINPQQRVFCLEYIKDYNATRAAKAAGYSEKSAEYQGSRLLAQEIIQDFVQKLIAEQEADLKFEANEVIKELVRIATFDSGVLEKVANGELKLEQLSADERRAISEYNITENITAKGDETTKITVKAHPKVRALDILAKHFNLFKDHEIEKGKALQLGYRLNSEGED